MMHDRDWFKAIFYAALGLIFGPFITFGLYALLPPMRSPSGEGTIAFAMLFWFNLPFVILMGFVSGPVFGFLWGLFGEQIKDLIFDATAYLNRILFDRKP